MTCRTRIPSLDHEEVTVNHLAEGRDDTQLADGGWAAGLDNMAIDLEPHTFVPNIGLHVLLDDDAVVPITKREKRLAAAAVEAAAIAADAVVSSSSAKASATSHADNVAAAAAASVIRRRQWCVQRALPAAAVAFLSVLLARAACSARAQTMVPSLISVFVEPAENRCGDEGSTAPPSLRHFNRFSFLRCRI
jgi:hypothetical protein